MTIDQKTKASIMEEFGRHEGDSGSPEVQIALMSRRIDELTEHAKRHKDDHHSRLGLIRLVGKRRRLLNYLRRTDPDRYRSVIEALNLRK